jgi:hypothetical protein
MSRRRRLVARLLLTVSLVGATTAHHHSILEDASAGRTASPVLDPRCDLAQTLSLHAVHRIVERETCWACHWLRHLAPPSDAALPEPIGSDRTLSRLPARAAVSVARFTKLTRGPPALHSV